MKSRVLEKIWITIAALGIGVSLFVNNSNKLIESDTETFSTAIIRKQIINKQPLTWLLFSLVFWLIIKEKEMDDLLAEVTPDMDGSEVVAQAKPILHTCKKVLELRKEHERLMPEQDSLLKDINELN